MSSETNFDWGEADSEERARRLRALAQNAAELVAKKNLAYGDSFFRCGEFLQLLYPDGIAPQQYRTALLLVRIFDKLMRVANDAAAFDENPFFDLVGYCLLGVAADIGGGKNRRTVK